MLSSLGISESYGELRCLQNALASQGIPSYDSTAFTSFIFDNADFQIATLTGHGTFHSLGGLMVCTPPVSSDPKTLKRSVEITSKQMILELAVLWMYSHIQRPTK